MVSIDAMDEAKKLGNSRVFNTIIIGVAAKNMDFDKQQWLDVIANTVPPKTVEINQKAFEVGLKMIIDAHTHTYPETIAKRAIEKLEKIRVRRLTPMVCSPA